MVEMTLRLGITYLNFSISMVVKREQNALCIICEYYHFSPSEYKWVHQISFK